MEKDTIYEIIKLISNNYSEDTFFENEELFSYFYTHCMSIRYYGDRIITIYLYLLNVNVSEDYEPFTYMNSNIIEDFNNYIMTVTQSFYDADKIVDDDTIKELFDLITDYDLFKRHKKKSSLISLMDEKTFARYLTGAMMVALNKGFFFLSNDNIKKLVGCINGNKYIKNVVDKGGIKHRNNDLELDYLYQYFSRYIDCLILLDRLNNDFLIQSLLKGYISDKKTLKIMFEKLSSTNLLEIFDYDVSEMVDVIEVSINADNDLDRKEVFNVVKEKLFRNNKYSYFLDFIIYDSRRNNYISLDEFDSIVQNICDDYIPNLPDEKILFLIKANKNCSNIFCYNILENLKNAKWKKQTKDKIKELLPNYEEKNYSFDEVIEFFNDCLQKGVKNSKLLYDMVKSFVKFLLNDDTFSFYVVNSKDSNGFFSEGNRYIKVKSKLFSEFSLPYDVNNEPKKAMLLSVILHEVRHYYQFMEMNDKAHISPRVYKECKEDILYNLYKKFYDDNHDMLESEHDAHLAENYALLKMLTKAYPDFSKTIQFYNRIFENEIYRDMTNIKMLELSRPLSFDEIFDKLVLLNPNLTIKYPYLCNEYNLDGTKKDIDIKTR